MSDWIEEAVERALHWPHNQPLIEWTAAVRKQLRAELLAAEHRGWVAGLREAAVAVDGEGHLELADAIRVAAEKLELSGAGDPPHNPAK